MNLASLVFWRKKHTNQWGKTIAIGAGIGAAAAIGGIAYYVVRRARANASAQVDVRLGERDIELPETLPAGRTTFAVHNESAEAHGFGIRGGNVEKRLFRTLKPGKTRCLTVDLAPGTYEVVSSAGNHGAEATTRLVNVTQ